jgi:hypothetical protein
MADGGSDIVARAGPLRKGRRMDVSQQERSLQQGRLMTGRSEDVWVSLRSPCTSCKPLSIPLVQRMVGRSALVPGYLTFGKTRQFCARLRKLAPNYYKLFPVGAGSLEGWLFLSSSV